jgi:plasmid maintenance system antidote protein VapI
MTLTEALKAVLAKTKESGYELERQTGVNRLTIARFMHGETSLRLDCADRLAEFFGIESTLPKAKGKTKKGAK